MKSKKKNARNKKKDQRRKAEVTERTSIWTYQPVRDFFGFFSFMLGIFLILILVSYEPKDPSWHTHVANSQGIANYGGMVGSHLADLCMQVLGYASFLLAGMAIWGAVLFVKRMTWKEGALRMLGLVCLLIPAALALNGLEPPNQSLPYWGGAMGMSLAEILQRWIGVSGTWLLGGSLFFGGLSLAFDLKWNDFRDASMSLTHRAWHVGAVLSQGVVKILTKASAFVWRLLGRGESKFAQEVESLSAREPISVRAPKAKRTPSMVESATKADIQENLEDEIRIRLQAQVPKAEHPKGGASKSSASSSKSSLASEYILPDLDLLEASTQTQVPIAKEDLLANARTLEAKLKNFGVFGRVKEVQPGPVVTMYEFEPAPGVKVNQVVRLSDDLALALSAISVRITPLPGKSVVGIEVANADREIVYLQDVLQASAFTKSPSKMSMGLGKDIAGLPEVADLRKMPHLLIAGSTGSGKSVGVNSMLVSVLFKATPADVRMILVDPKMLELSLYNDIPHLLLPVVTDPRKAAAALRWAVAEMERRYRLMADLGVRNLEGYNKKVWEVIDSPQTSLDDAVVGATLAEDDPSSDGEEHTGPLPLIMIVIDELADLMMVSSREVEESIIRLAQMARASGIHLILATQRPSVDVITGLIKANMPSRMSFQVSSKIDSRTILDTSGAEVLLGSGDMLFLPPGTSKLKRIHGAFVSDDEVKRITDHWKAQAQPDYNENILKIGQIQENEARGEDPDDEVYYQALELVRTHQMASISMIQRKMRIGYNRAARIVERMEEEGVLGPQEGSKPREVYLTQLEP